MKIKIPVILTPCLFAIIILKDHLMKIVEKLKKCPLNAVKNVSMVKITNKINIELNHLMVLEEETKSNRILKIMDQLRQLSLFMKIF